MVGCWGSESHTIAVRVRVITIADNPIAETPINQVSSQVKASHEIRHSFKCGASWREARGYVTTTWLPPVGRQRERRGGRKGGSGDKWTYSFFACLCHCTIDCTRIPSKKEHQWFLLLVPPTPSFGLCLCFLIPVSRMGWGYSLRLTVEGSSFAGRACAALLPTWRPSSNTLFPRCTCTRPSTSIAETSGGGWRMRSI